MGINGYKYKFGSLITERFDGDLVSEFEKSEASHIISDKGKSVSETSTVSNMLYCC